MEVKELIESEFKMDVLSQNTAYFD